MKQKELFESKKILQRPILHNIQEVFFQMCNSNFWTWFFYVSYVKKGAKHKYTLTVEWRSVAFFPFFFFISNLHPCYTLRSEWKVTLKAPIQIYLLIPIKKNRSFVEQY